MRTRRDLVVAAAVEIRKQVFSKQSRICSYGVGTGVGGTSTTWEAIAHAF